MICVNINMWITFINKLISKESNVECVPEDKNIDLGGTVPQIISHLFYYPST